MLPNYITKENIDENIKVRKRKTAKLEYVSGVEKSYK